MSTSNVPTGGLAIILLGLFLKLDEAQGKERNLSLRAKFGRMDIMGTVLFLGAMCCLIFALQQGGQKVPWNSSTIIGLFVGFGTLLLTFSFVQWILGEKALIPLRILRQRSILMGSLYVFFLGILNGLVSHVDLVVPLPAPPVNAYHSMDSTFRFTFRSSKASHQLGAVFE